MILDYYRIFYYVAQYKSFSKAAEVMGNNQPNITRCMNILENELGCKLFIRSNRGVQLTVEGERLHNHVSIAMEQLVAGENELLKEKADSGIHGFLIIDMDHFKDVNDIYGHIMGDKVLKMFGGFLKEQFREQDVIGRIGGDEFVVLLYNIGSRENMESRIEDLCKKIRKLHIEGMEEYQFTASMGIAFAPRDGDAFMELYQKADMALYQTKKSGRDGYRIYQQVHEKTT